MRDPFAIAARLLGAVMVVISLAWSSSVLTMAGFHGIVDPDLAQIVTGNFPMSLYRLLNPSPSFDIALVVLCNSLAVFGAAMYWRPRSVLLSLAAYLALVMFKQTVPLIAYGVFEFLQLGLFYLFVGNLARWLFRRDEAFQWKAERLVGWFFRGHLAMAYLSAGLCKAVGPQWWNGESMWRALARSDNSGQRWFNLEWTAHFPILLQAAGVATLLFESLYPLAFVPKLRRIIVPAMIGMHLATIGAQGLTIFGITMIMLNVFFWMESAAWEKGRQPVMQAAEEVGSELGQPEFVTVS
jgi:hypothetical protein